MPKDIWTIGKMLSWMEGYLADHGDENPLISTRWLLSDASGLSFMQLYTNLDKPLQQSELDVLHDYVKRRAQGEPVQYIIGKTSFRHIDVIVRKNVLIPRPETEVLVSEVLARLPQRRFHVDDEPYDGELANVADLCTGSGCIACSLAFENPALRVFATDISESCTDLARENVDALSLSDRVEVLKCDLGSDIPNEYIGKFSAVVSNPPYIPTSVLAEMPNEVNDFEPSLALDGGEDGLDVFRRIARWSYQALDDNGFLAVELHETCLDSAADISSSIGYKDSQVIFDLAGKPRILISFKNAYYSQKGWQNVK